MKSGAALRWLIGGRAAASMIAASGLGLFNSYSGALRCATP